ncbi:MAG: hypothetical protein HZA79_11095 [Sphingobacteriales bacterium]|nr:hypothetical protein [Sphingobacteriales bacterium]
MGIKNSYKKLKDWCNANQGLLTLLGLIVAILPLIPFNKIDFKSAGPVVDKIISVLVYEVKIPLYLFIVILTISGFYFLRIKRRYTKKSLTLRELTGTWRNDWGTDGDHEIFTLNENGNYVINGEHVFNLTDFNFDPKSNKITFYKTAVRPGDERKVFNSVEVKNNELLDGFEQNYKIKYTKISS